MKTKFVLITNYQGQNAIYPKYELVF